MLRASALVVACVACGCSSLPTVALDASHDAADVPCEASVCEGRCVDLARDTAHCGACGNACGEGVECIRGVCSRRVAQLSAENATVCARLVDGAVWCWGSNVNGECGDGSKETTRPLPVRVPGVTATFVAAGWSGSCAVSASGVARCWGNNTAQAIADDARPVVRAPEAVMFPRPVTAMNLSDTICALLDDASVWCRPMFAGVPGHPNIRWIDHVVAMDGGWGHLCALRDDGSVGCGGRRGMGMFGDGNTTLNGMDYVTGPIAPVGLPRAVQLVSSATGGCVRTALGEVWCWGLATLSTPNGTAWTAARAEGLGTVRELWSLGRGYLVRRSDGALLAWGYNLAGAVGDGTVIDRFVPVRPTALDAIADDIVSVAGGPGFACALLRDSTVRCWGSNTAGQLGQGTLSSRSLAPVSPRW